MINYENSENPINDKEEAINDWENMAKEYVPYSEKPL